MFIVLHLSRPSIRITGCQVGGTWAGRGGRGGVQMRGNALNTHMPLFPDK